MCVFLLILDNLTALWNLQLATFLWLSKTNDFELAMDSQAKGGRDRVSAANEMIRPFGGMSGLMAN